MRPKTGERINRRSRWSGLNPYADDLMIHYKRRYCMGCEYCKSDYAGRPECRLDPQYPFPVNRRDLCFQDLKGAA
jgi:hypothetical protein